jgi:uncharacterized protein (DUF4415 family)
MSGNERPLGSDLAFIDAYENTAADYEEIPELTEADLARARWYIGDREVSEAEGRAAMAEALASHRERVELELGGDVLAAYRATGPDWRDRMAAALRKAVGL